MAIPRHEWLLMAVAVPVLAAAAFAVAVVPFRYIARFASWRARGRVAISSADSATVAAIATAVIRCARRVPWRAKCFEQGLAAQFLLRLRGLSATLHYGVARLDDRHLAAHVWVRSGDLDVVGCRNAGDFTELLCFPARG